MSGEDFKFSQEQENRERSQNIGAEVLMQMPEFSERMQSFSKAKQNGEVPEEVRDEQDYKEYTQEKEARLNEARTLIWNTYCDEGMPDNAGYTEEVKDFLSSESLKTVVNSGFNLDEMLKDGILSKADGRYIGSTIPGLAKQSAFNDAKEIIGDLADFCELTADMPSPEYFVNEMRGIFDNWHKNSLKAAQYATINNWITPGTGLRNRLMYGEVIDENGVLTINTEQVNHTLHLIETLQGIQDRYDPNCDILLRLYVEKIKTKPEEISQYLHNDIKSAFGKAARKRFDAVLDSICYDGAARDVAKSVITAYDFDLIKKAKEATDRTNEWFVEPLFTDEELLSSIYDIDPSDKTEKLYGRKEAANRLPRDFAALEEAGFSRDSLLNIIHDKNVPIHIKEVVSMRRAGISDVDIAYASKAYERFIVDEDEERDWFNPINNDFFAREKEGYDPAFGLSDTDILNAANKNYWRNERLDRNTSEE
ncbi:hypothetical protein IJ076_03015 [Candidatus Saccharibacteria bacterium]|nr:hypothetical protein [Candidatus Saccharibacteria bacterium]